MPVRPSQSHQCVATVAPLPRRQWCWRRYYSTKTHLGTVSLDFFWFDATNSSLSSSKLQVHSLPEARQKEESPGLSPTKDFVTIFVTPFWNTLQKYDVQGTLNLKQPVAISLANCRKHQYGWQEYRFGIYWYEYTLIVIVTVTGIPKI
jgi:hypothetical protein